MLRQKRFWLGVAISLGLVFFLFYKTDLGAIAAALGSANYFYLIPALALYFAGVFVRAVRWHLLLRSIKSVPVRALFPVVVIGYMANDLLPARIGELVRAYLLGEQQSISKASILVTVFLERLLDGLTMVAFIAIASVLLPLNDYFKALMAFGAAVFIAITIALVLVAGLRERIDPLIHFLISRLPVHWGDRATKLIHSFLHGLSVLRNPIDALGALFLSFLAWSFETGMYIVLALGFKIYLSLPVFILAAAVANLLTIAPSTPGYVGVFDAPVKYVLTQFSDLVTHEPPGPSLATSYTLVLHAALIIPVTLLGLYYAWRAGLSLTQLSRRAEISAEPTS